MAEHKVQQYKVEAVEKLKGWFTESPDLIFSDFRGLTFPQMTDLRAKLGEQQDRSTGWCGTPSRGSP